MVDIGLVGTGAFASPRQRVEPEAAAAAALDDAGEARSAVGNCLTVGTVVPHFMLRFARDADHERLLALLRKAGLPD